MPEENQKKFDLTDNRGKWSLVWEPEVFNLPDDKFALMDLVKRNSPLITNDIESQLSELVKLRNPNKKLTDFERQEAIKNELNNRSLDNYGKWFYYPWANRLVHLLEEDAFIEVRTNRNHYKISPEEERVLSNKKVGLIGLSVGQSVAVTMAMERGFGELRLADFDTLELTNLNRIRTGVHNLGIAKVISVAREIMEIDPYLKLTCFTDGLTENNIDAFFSEGGNLDLLIDECDGLDMKIIARWKARELGIPVVMEASDRGMVDVERFDLEPNRKILHGLVDDLSPEKLKALSTNEEKIPYMLDVVGLETISTRAQASMLEIGETITTWPQLASAVALGGGITADVVRRIFLDHFKGSGRYYIDVEELIGDGNAARSTPNKNDFSPSNNFGTSPVSGKIKIEKSIFKKIVKAACHAPSGGNLQPWKWSCKGNLLQLYFDRSLISSFLDSNDIASMIALGASLENARLESVNQGYECEVSLFPNSSDKNVVAHLHLTEPAQMASEADLVLASSILQRETNRQLEDSPPLSRTDLQRLTNLGPIHGSELLIIERGADYDRLADLIAFAEKFRILNPIGHQNFNEEMRWSKEEAERTRDGIDVRSVELTEGELAGFKLARFEGVIEKLREWNGGDAFKKLSKKSTNSASALGIIMSTGSTSEHYLKAGMDMERVWIAANSLGIGFQPQSPLTLMLPKINMPTDITKKELKVLTQASDQLHEILKPYTSQIPIFIFRLFYKKREVVRSFRREIDRHFRFYE